ncbi:MAG: DNA repair exonuclease [Planctomycetota bacterium]|nr:MAG: DNA repair exonuclease [Planctomycetota bacterium]
MFRFVHAADLHLDSPLKGLEAYPGAPVDCIRGATRRALENLVDLARRERVDFVLLAGDIYDGDWPDHNTGLFFVGQMLRLREAGIPVVAISGNHDAANKITKALRLPDNVFMLSHQAPETAGCPKLRDLGVAVHGMSYAQAKEKRNLVLDYPRPLPGMFNIGLLHTGLTGREGHEPYAPCSLDDLRARGYDYWALGHIHAREIVCHEPWVIFSGNTQGRHVRETGAKGCYVVTVNDGGEVQADFHPLDVLRWEVCRADVGGIDDEDDFIAGVGAAIQSLVETHGGMTLAMRVEIVGKTDLHEALHGREEYWKSQVRAAALEVAGEAVWIEQVKLATAPPSDTTSDLEGPLEELVLVLQDLKSSDQAYSDLVPDLSKLRKKLKREQLDTQGELQWDDPQWWREVLAEVEPMLLAQLRQEA